MDKIKPNAVSDFKCVLLVIPRIQNAPNKPLTKAPINNTLVSLVPVIKKAIAIPGKAACEIASPNKLCFRNTAKLPNIPQIEPNIAVPKVIVRKV